MRIGLDFGTTNTVAAVIGEDGAPIVLPLDAASPTPRMMRTLLYVERNGAIHLGADAIRLHRLQNVGRMPRYTKQWIGMLDIEVGDMVVKGYEINAGPTAVDVFADVDADAPGRLIHALKGPLATNYAGTKLFGKYFSLEELIAEFLRRVKEQIETHIREPITGAVFGRPVNFAGAQTAQDNTRAQNRLAQAAQLAGFDEVSFEMEPIAAGLSYGLAQGSQGPHRFLKSVRSDKPRESFALVFDFGGGTLDVAVLRILADGSQKVLATGGVGIAGDHFDQHIFRKMVLPWFGRDVRWGAQRLAMPGHIVNALGDWQDIPALATPDTLAFVNEAQKNCDDPARMFALEDLIFKGHAYPVYDQAERAKVALSQSQFAVMAYDTTAIHLWQPVTRRQFEAMLASDRRAIEAMIYDTLARAGVKAGQIEHVVRTGGSSSIPIFVDLLAHLFEHAQVTEEDLFTSIAAGLAVRANEGMK